MRIVAIVGLSETGKTRLAARLISELRRRGLRVAAVKRCAHGFSLDTEGKDSADFSAAGAEGVALVSPEGWAAFGSAPDVDAARLVARLFADVDVALIEGGKDVRGIRKIEVLRAGVSEIPVSPPGQLAALVSDLPAAGNSGGVAALVVADDSVGRASLVVADSGAAPVFGPDDVSGIADLILSLEEADMADITLEVDGREVNLNAFVKTFIEKTLLGMVTALSGVDPDPKRISIVVDRGGDRGAGKARP